MGLQWLAQAVVVSLTGLSGKANKSQTKTKTFNASWSLYPQVTFCHFFFFFYGDSQDAVKNITPLRQKTENYLNSENCKAPFHLFWNLNTGTFLISLSPRVKFCHFFMVTHLLLFAFIMIPMMQREFDTFKDNVWNCHRIRPQKDAVLPAGIPDHIYCIPEEYGLEQCGNLDKIIIVYITCSEQEVGFLIATKYFSVFLQSKLHPSHAWANVVHVLYFSHFKPRHWWFCGMTRSLW